MSYIKNTEMEKETNIDAMKYRTHTHLAGVDVQVIVDEKGKCELTIKECAYVRGALVNGQKKDAYIIEFVEPNITPMIANSGNRKKIVQIVSQTKQISLTDARFINTWGGTKIELKFDPTIKFGREIVGGIVVVLPEFKPVQQVSDANAIQKLSACTTLDAMKSVWEALTTEEKNLPTVQAKKEELKSKFAGK